MKVLTDQQHYQDIAEAILAKTGGTTKLKPAEMAQALNDLNIELEEIYVTPTTEEQTIEPSEGYYGISRVVLGAAVDGGGGSGSAGTVSGGAAEDITFGDEYTESEVETGLLVYSSGTDENAIPVPPIPDGEYQILFQKANVGCHFQFDYHGTLKEVETDVPASMYAATGHHESSEGGYGCVTCAFIYTEYSGGFYRSRDNGGDWYNWRTLGNPTQIGSIGSGHGIDEDCHLKDAITGLPKYDVGVLPSLEEVVDAMEALGTTAQNERGDTFMALVSSSQIIFDGVSVSNADGSPMTIYECTSADRNTWVEIGQTNGGYSTDGYALTWNSHDLLDASGENVTYTASAAPIADTETVLTSSPADRNETYSIDGNTLNSIVGAAQKITGSQNTLTPNEAAEILDEYYTSPTAEEGKF